METEKEDFLVTQPQQLQTTIDTVLNVYDQQRGGSSMVGQAAELMQPAVIERMRALRADLTKHFL